MMQAHIEVIKAARSHCEAVTCDTFRSSCRRDNQFPAYSLT